MSAHVLLNLINKLRKRDKMQGLPIILSLFRNEFIKFNNTGALMFDFIYHMTLKMFKITVLAGNVKNLPSFSKGYNGRHRGSAVAQW